MTKFASGKKALAVCDRCGLAHKYTKMQTEPGTKLFVCPKCNDGQWNRVDHPQNFAPKNNGPEAISLKNPRPDRKEPQVLLVNASGSVIVGDDGLPFFISSEKNILGVSYVSA